MAQQSKDAIATVLLTCRLLSSHAKALTSRDIWRLVDAGVSPGELLESVPDALPGKLDPGRLAERFGLAPRYELVVDELAGSGVSMVTVFDEGYPDTLRDRLGSNTPVLLYVAGDVHLLRRGGVGIVGSRDVSESGMDSTSALAIEAVERGLPVVSGCARGVDQAAMSAAYAAQGEFIGFPADRLGHLIRQAETRRGLNAGRVVLASPYVPDARFSVGNAMGRNKLIYASADVTVAMAASAGKGGTWAGATEALRRGFGRVAVLCGSTAPEGNAALLAEGAEELRSVEGLRALLAKDPADPADGDAPEQLGLGV